ncbi:putative Ig domain-containing protein [Bacteroides sp. GM023]|uniref:putative Ig domain-containing protein n=1 Tax=Bacteroides sp. GM023 TaxID=2723058 RepID=UPI00168B3724|nr:putative Ig domain-containing protein [Bacteroides sp. GM023]MBD3588517.1 alpha-galactosidase [Bacteroides sp. GM023]
MNKQCFLTVVLFFSFLVNILSVSAGNPASEKIFEGKPVINAPQITGNYPSTPFIFYIPTSGQRPMEWSVDKLPKGLKLNPETGIISGTIASKGDYTVTLKAKNALGTCEQKMIIRIGDELLLTPPMGWNSWNTFGRHLTEELVLQTADAMIANGMRDLGYSFINIDDFWQLPERGSDGHLQIDKTKFPRGIKYVADYLHERGFKLGIYSDAADKTCGGVCGSYGYEEVDAKDFASWGVDLLKYDYCNAPAGRVEAMNRYAKMGKALRATDRSIVFSICEWGQREPWKWAKEVGGHLWRVSGDIGDVWNREANQMGGLRGILNILEINAPLNEYAGPAGWNDPDMLVVGIGGKSMSIGSESEGCTQEQYKSHFGLWCMMASPLLCGNDVRNMNDSTLQILLDKDLIAINQDMLGKQAERSIRADYYDVWVKPLADGRKAVACFNRTNSPQVVELNTQTVEDLSLNQVYSLDTRTTVDTTKGIIVKLAPYQCKIYICGEAKKK